MKQINPLLRSIIFPITATAVAIWFWVNYCCSWQWWWIALLAIIAITHYWVFFSKKKKSQ